MTTLASNLTQRYKHRVHGYAFYLTNTWHYVTFPLFQYRGKERRFQRRSNATAVRTTRGWHATFLTLGCRRARARPKQINRENAGRRDQTHTRETRRFEERDQIKTEFEKRGGRKGRRGGKVEETGSRVISIRRKIFRIIRINFIV